MNTQFQLDDFDDYMVLPVIFQHLDLIDLLNCRLVSKKWKHFIDKIKIKELIVTKSNPIEMRRYVWHHSNRLIYYKNSFPSLNVFRIQVPMFRNLIENLKYLNITFDLNQTDQFKIDHLNYFKHLEHLNLSNIEMNESVELVLPELRILSLDGLHNTYDSRENFHSTILTVDSPKLEVLHANDIKKLRLVHYKSVKRLHIGSSLIDEQSIQLFSSVQILQCDCCQISSNAIDRLPNLKELICNYKSSLLVFEENLVPKIQNLFNHSNRIKISLLGVQLNGECPILESDLREPIKLHVRHYENLSTDLNWFNSMDYSRLMNLNCNLLPNSFFCKYTNIQIVSAEKIIDQNHFIMFLRECKKLSKLSILNSLNKPLSQEFYDQLANFTRLIELTIRESKEIQINFDFIFDLYHLHYFQTDVEMKIDLVLELIKKNSYLSLIYFENNGVIYLIQKNGQTNYDLAYLYSLEDLRYTSLADQTKLNYDQLVQMIRSLSIV